MLRHLQSIILDGPISSEPLMASADKLMQLVTHTQAIGTWRVDLETGKAWWSPRVYEIHGLRPDENGVDLNAAIRAYHPQDAKTVAWLIMNAIENKVGFTFVLRLQRSDGETRLVQSAASVDVDADGTVRSLYGIFKDVTDRFTEKDVAEGRGRLVRSIIAHSPAPLIVLDRHMRYLEINPSWIEFYRLPPANQLIGRSHYEVMTNLPEEFREHNRRALDGEIIHSKYSYIDANNRKSTQRGAVIFPWKTTEEEIGGIIIMLTPPDQLHAADATLDEIASLFGQSGKPRRTPEWVSDTLRSQRVRSGSRW